MAQTGGFLKRHSLAVGLILMFLLTWPIDLSVAAESRGMLPFDVPMPVYILVGYGIVIASLVMTGLTLGREGIGVLLRRYLIWRVGLIWFAVALLTAPAIDLLAIGINAALTHTPVDFTRVMARQILGPASTAWYGIPGFFIFDMVTNGEEIGWRGYALPRFQAKYSALISSLILGVIWAIWHIPKFLTAGNSNPFGWFVLDIVAKAVLFTWVYNNTKGSLLIVTMFHAAINTAGLFLPASVAATGDPGPTAIVAIIEAIVAAGVIIAAGADRLSRSAARQIQT